MIAMVVFKALPLDRHVWEMFIHLALEPMYDIIMCWFAHKLSSTPPYQSDHNLNGDWWL